MSNEVKDLKVIQVDNFSIVEVVEQHGSLIPIYTDENGEPYCLGRELYKFLEIPTDYKDWFPRMAKYGFEEGVDFSSFLSESTGGRPSTNHKISLDMSKELSMIQRTEKGKQARQYYLKIEKAWNDPIMVQRRAMQHLQIQTNIAIKKYEEIKPKAIFADAVSASQTSILVGELGKLLKQNGIEMGQKRLFEWLRENGYLIKRQGTDYNMPTKKSMEKELFEIKETAIVRSNGSTSISKTSKVTGKGQIYFVQKFLGGEKND